MSVDGLWRPACGIRYLIRWPLTRLHRSTSLRNHQDQAPNFFFLDKAITSTTLKAVVSASVALETEQTTLKSMLEASIQFQIPIYQRTYDWTKQNCQQLYDDIMKSGKTKEENYHFIGAITCVGIPTSISDNVKRYQLIDGQQRITSLMLLLRALRDKLDASAVVTTAMIDQLLFNVTEEKSRSNYYKMALADNDDQPFREIMGDGSSKTSGSIAANFRHFTALLKGEDADSVWYGVKKLDCCSY